MRLLRNLALVSSQRVNPVIRPGETDAGIFPMTFCSLSAEWMSLALSIYTFRTVTLRSRLMINGAAVSSSVCLSVCPRQLQWVA
jgi:hypothetical protein